MKTDLELARLAYDAYVAEMSRYILPGTRTLDFARRLDEVPRQPFSAWLEAIRAVTRELCRPPAAGRDLQRLWAQAAQRHVPSSRWTVNVATIGWDELPADAQAAWDEVAKSAGQPAALVAGLSEHPPGPGEEPVIREDDDADLPATGSRGPVTLGRQAYEAFWATLGRLQRDETPGRLPEGLTVSWTALPPSQRLAWCDAAARVSRISERLSADRRPAALRHACGAVCAEPGENICISAGSSAASARDVEAELARSQRHVCEPEVTCPDPRAHLLGGSDERVRRDEIMETLLEMDKPAGVSADGRVMQFGLRALVLALTEHTDIIGEGLS